jgi:PAS domain S-box-containing protein
MAEPIRDAQGKVIGVLFGVINLSLPNFLDKMTKTKYGSAGGYLLTDPKHKLFITGTDPSRVMQPTPARGVNPLFDRCMDGFEGYDVGVSSRGIEELVAVKGVPAAGWFLAIVQPTKEAFAAVHTQQRRMLVATLVLTLLAAGLIWWMTSWMLKRQFAPMLEAAHTLDALSSSGQPPQPLPIARNDEIGELIGGFNRLLLSINQRENFLKQILDTSSVAIFLVDMQGRITLANQRMAEMFHCTVKDLQGQEYVALLHPTERDSGRNNMLALLNSQVALVAVDRFYWRPDETEFWGHLTGKRFFDVNGAERGLIGVIVDIDERKQAEEELLRSNRELEQFSYSISHDMRQPLRMISSYLQLLEMKLAQQLDEEKREYFHYAIDGAKRLDAMLLGLLDYSRVGRKGEPAAWVQSRAVLDEALLFLQPAMVEAQAQVQIKGEWPAIFVSPDEMLRLMQNLVGNALKFRVAGRTLDITITSETRGENWRFCVADNGIGILPDQIGRLFQVFARLQSRAAFEGTGIGLALCRKIAEHHGGKIGVESGGEGLGSRFCVDLPLPPTAPVTP